MTREDVLSGLKLVHYFFTSYEGSEAAYHMYRESIVDDAIRKAIPAAIELLKVVELSPPPLSVTATTLLANRKAVESARDALNQWVQRLEQDMRRVEERIDTLESYYSQARSLPVSR